MYKRLHQALIKDLKPLSELIDQDIDVYSLILLHARTQAELGSFGYFEKPRQSAAVMGLFLSDGVMREKLKKAGLTSSAHEWEYVSCASYWLQMARVAGEMFRDSRARSVDGLDDGQIKLALSAWRDLFTDLAAKVLNYRVSFCRLAVDSGVSAARAALSEVELAAQVFNLEAEEMAETRAEYKKAYLKACMKQEAASAAAAKRAANTAEGESSARN